MTTKTDSRGMFYGNVITDYIKFGEAYAKRRSWLAFEKSKFVIDVEKLRTSCRYREYLLSTLPLYVNSKIVAQNEMYCTKEQMDIFRSKCQEVDLGIFKQ